jgi:hypothetical protein
MFGKFDPVEGCYVVDRIAGIREDLGSTPSVSNASGAPTGPGLQRDRPRMEAVLVSRKLPTALRPVFRIGSL